MSEGWDIRCRCCNMSEGNIEALKSRLYQLQTVKDKDIWTEKCEGYPVFSNEENIFHLKFYSLPERQVHYDILVDTNIYFEKNNKGIQWTLIKENIVMAISFKEQFSANAFWQLIEDYQKKYSIVVPATENIIFYFQYKVPDPTPRNLSVILNQLTLIPEAERHQRVVSIFLTKRDLLPKLILVFKTLQNKMKESGEQMKGLEEGVAEQMKGLGECFEIMKIVFNAANEELLYEMLLSEMFPSVLGVLEYDPRFKNSKPSHRQFMAVRAKLLEVVSFRQNEELLALVIFTYRLQYVRECILHPYLSDYSAEYTYNLILLNYHKINKHIFNPQRKEFIDTLFDLLRRQNLLAFKMLREIFQINKLLQRYPSKLPSANEFQFYVFIAEHGFFDIFFENLREALGKSLTNKPKKKKSEDLQEIVLTCFEMIEQFLELEGGCIRAHCAGEKYAKQPIAALLLDQFAEANSEPYGDKIGQLLRCLVADDEHPLKHTLKPLILAHTLPDQKLIFKWLPILHELLFPCDMSSLPSVVHIVQCLVNALHCAPSQRHLATPFLPSICVNSHPLLRTEQLQILTFLRHLIHAYFITSQTINKHLIPLAPKFAAYLLSNVTISLRSSTFLSILVPQQYSELIAALVYKLRFRLHLHNLFAKEVLFTSNSSLSYNPCAIVFNNHDQRGCGGLDRTTFFKKAIQNCLKRESKLIETY